MERRGIGEDISWCCAKLESYDRRYLCMSATGVGTGAWVTVQAWRRFWGIDNW